MANTDRKSPKNGYFLGWGGCSGLGTRGLPDTDTVLFLNLGSGYSVIHLYFFVIIV